MQDTIDTFATKLEGDLVTPGSDRYDDARSVWNGMIDRRPALIARCLTPGDVVTAVDFARQRDLLIAVRGGGHNVAGHGTCDDGLVLDLSPMDAVSVDPRKRTARVQGGAVWAQVDDATTPHGLAVPNGLVSTTGVGGLTLGGGFGWISRAHGLTCDNLLSAQVVTADAETLTASDRENPELFWALRGGGGNFGVVTELEFALHPVGKVLAGLVIHPLDRATSVLRSYRDIVRKAPDELTCYLLFRPAPAAPFLPEEVHGEPILALVICALGDPDSAEAAARPLRELGDPLADVVSRRPYVEWQRFSDANWEPGYRDYWKADYLTGLPDAALDTLVEHAATLPTPHSDFKIAHFEGAVGRPSPSATAFPHRDAPFVLNVNARWEDPAEDGEHIAWARRLYEAMQPFASGVYVNFLGDEGEERVRQAYGENYQRLARIKADYDPKNLFRMNQNIEPAAALATA